MEQFQFSDFHLRKASEPVPAAPEHFRFLFLKIPKSFQNDSGTLQELSGMCWNHFDLMAYPETTFSVSPKLIRWPLSAELFRCPKLFRVRNYFDDFLSDSLSSIQQIDDPYACDPIGSVKYRHDLDPLPINDQHRSRGHPYWPLYPHE